MRVYATAADYTAVTGQSPPSGIDQQLADASEMLDAEVFRLCWYDTDTAGLPTNTTVAAAFARAVVQQVRWWVEVGDDIGAAGAGWGSVGIGSVSLSRGAGGAPDGSDSPARQVAPRAWSALRSPDLTPAIFVLGVVCT
ncbi:hypothetical protein RM780_04005 [Streptomyces sp. DSM 44917]|uniref:Uncharacterized protein n=1 Tax=Streptomyces boetiae TaxID=3075541 RepID=A0ABU2L3I5_9ACTN|nr:hypothetical protein [Streptomyces sp. DSM 44917]MDT0306126.1 hypothetical protein [Streptomyces sp. DSM 44917]